MAPSASAASWRTMGCSLAFSSSAMRIPTDSASCIWPRQKAISWRSSAEGSSRPAHGRLELSRSNRDVAAGGDVAEERDAPLANAARTASPPSPRSEKSARKRAGSGVARSSSLRSSSTRSSSAAAIDRCRGGAGGAR
jgi:hypothetical protein